MTREFVSSALNSAGSTPPSYYKTDTFVGCQVGDLLVVGGAASGCVTGGTARAITTTGGSTGDWTTTATSPTGANVDTIMGWAVVSAAGDITVQTNVRMPPGEYMNACGYRIPAAEWTGTPAFTTATADTDKQLSVTVGQDNSLVLLMEADYNGVNPGTTNTPAGGTNDASFSGTYYATAWRSWHNQASGTRNYGPSGVSGCVSGIIVCVVDQGAAYPEPITLRAAGTATSATAAVTAVNPAVPAGATTGDLSVLTVWAKPYSATITTPSGWTKIGEQTNGTTASGTDTGSTKVAVYVRESASVGAIGNITQSGADSMGAVINTYAKDAAKVWDFSAFTDGGDTTNGANYSATGAAGIDVAADDWVLQSTAVNGDVGTLSAFAIGGMSGATLGTYASRQSAAVTTGNDTRGVVGDIPVTAGSSSAAPTFTYTNASNGSGTTMWLRLRQTASSGQSAAVNPATETDAAQVLARRKVKALGVALETDSAQALARRKTDALGVTTETDAAQPLTRRKVKALGVALETDTAVHFVQNIVVDLLPAAETDAAQPLARRKVKALGVALETDAAQPLARRKVKALGVALETDTAQPLARRKVKALGVALETDTAQPVTRQKTRAITAATETDAAQPLSRRKARVLGVALETDSALPIVEEGSQALVVSPATETDQALPINRRKTRAIGPALETDAAVPLVRVRARTVLPAAETDVSRPIGRRKGYAVGTALETDLALPVIHVGLIVLPVGTALETELARPVGRVKTRSIGVATETDGALALARLKTRPVGTALETDLARPILQWVPESGISWREILVQRRITHWFIRGDPITLTLVPRTRVQTSTGGFQWVELAARAPQIMQLIEPPTPSDPVITADGQQREVHFILLGEWDATIGMYDVFEALDCQWEVIQIYHNNGYERRAAVARYG